MKKLLSLTLALLLVLTLLPVGVLTASADPSDDLFDNFSDGFYYSVSDDKATIIGYEGLSGAVTVPATLGGYPVTAIRDFSLSSCPDVTSFALPAGITEIGIYVFNDCPALTSITVDAANTVYHSAGNCLIKTATKTLIAGSCNSIIPTDGSVTAIGDYAFAGCGITSIVIPDSVTAIGDYAFEECAGLTSVTFGSGLESIGFDAFYACGLTSVALPASVTSIGDEAFACNPALASITVDAANTVYHSAGNCLIKTEYNAMILGCKNSVIPTDGSVTVIGDYAFEGCEDLTSITIPDVVTTLEFYAFAHCTGLTSIALPASVGSVNTYAFFRSDNIETITVDAANTVYHSAGNCLIETATKTLIRGCKNSVIPTDGSVTGIGKYAFENCAELTSVTLPDGITEIGENAFDCCSGLTSVTIPDSVTKMDGFAFANCDGLVSVSLGKNLEKLDWCVFENCESLTAVVIPDSVTCVANYAFFDCTSLANVTIGAGVTEISESAFENCEKLTSVVLPDGVTTLGDNAFCNCTGLTAITVPDTVTSIGYDALYGCPSLTVYGFSANSYAKTYAEANGIPYLIKKTGHAVGDVNGDGAVDAKDRTVLARYLAEWHIYGGTNYDDIDFAAADVNGDKTVDAKDRTVLARYLAEWHVYGGVDYDAFFGSSSPSHGNDSETKEVDF